MQPSGAIGCGLPIAAAGRPFYFVEVSEAPAQAAPSPQRSLEASQHGGAACHLPKVGWFIWQWPAPLCCIVSMSMDGFAPMAAPTAATCPRWVAALRQAGALVGFGPPQLACPPWNATHYGGASCHLPTRCRGFILIPKEPGLAQVHTPKGVLSLMAASSAASACCESPMMMDPATSVPFPGLELGFVLGRGAFGSVFRGTYNGEPVAVKVGGSCRNCPSTISPYTEPSQSAVLPACSAI